MKVTINDEVIELADNATLQAALEAVNAPLNGVATALNGEVVSASERPTTPLTDGDSILLIKAFYGG